MSILRFNHMELTLAPGTLTKEREALTGFYREVFGFDAIDVPLFDQTGLLLRTDADTSQFILLMEQERPLHSPGYDHLGFLLQSRAEVDEKLRLCKLWQARDPRVEIKEYDDLVIQNVTTRAFYFRYLLPIWFDVQVIEYAPGGGPAHTWRFEPVPPRH